MGRVRAHCARLILSLAAGCAVALATAWGPLLPHGSVWAIGSERAAERTYVEAWGEETRYVGVRVDRLLRSRVLVQQRRIRTRDATAPSAVSDPRAVVAAASPRWVVVPAVDPADAANLGFIEVRTHGFGFPARCVRAWTAVFPAGAAGPDMAVFPGATRPVSRPTVLEGGLLRAKGLGFRLELPVSPIWRGLLLNVAVWTAAAWSLSLLPGLAMRQHRRRRGRCPGCGYDRSGLGREAACPECGRGGERRAARGNRAARGV